MLEVFTATILSIFALLAAVFSTDWILGNGKHSDKYNKNSKKDNMRPGIYAFEDIMEEIERKRMSNLSLQDKPF